ncbi:MAG: hypothetical protein JKX93_01570 [Rhizobiaceae bacterium]|nr:hypothetical protein [Rhizobiaceae bacterium]
MKQLLTDPEGVIGRGEFLKGFKIVVLLIIVSWGIYYGSVLATASMPVHTTGMLPFLGVPLFFAIISTLYFAFCIYAKRLRDRGYSSGWVTTCLLAFFFAISARFAAQQIVGTGAAEAAADQWVPLVLNITFVGFLALHVGLVIWMTLMCVSAESKTKS